MDEYIPDETATIAAVRAARIIEKQKEQKAKRLSRRWWTGKHVEYGFLMIVFLLNLYLVYPFFGSKAPEIPFSSPTIPVIAKVISLGRMPLSYAIQIVNILFLLLFSFSFYIFVRLISGRRLVALLAVLFASLPFYPFAGLRIKNALLGGDGPHIANLAVLPMAIYGILLFLRKGGINYLLLASVASTLVALTSPLGFMTFMIFAALTAFSEMLLGHSRLKIARLLTVFVAVSGLVSFWHNPGFVYWMVMGPMGEEVRSMVWKLVPVSFFSIPLLAIFGFLLFDRKPGMQPLFLASFYTITFAIISLAGGGFIPAHPSRYTPELGISLAFLLGLGVVEFSDAIRDHRLDRVEFFKRAKATSLANATIVLCALAAVGIILAKGSSSYTESVQVLGISTEVARGGLWIEKEKSGHFPTLVGYAITIGTVASLGYLKMKVSKSRV